MSGRGIHGTTLERETIDIEMETGPMTAVQSQPPPLYSMRQKVREEPGNEADVFMVDVFMVANVYF